MYANPKSQGPLMNRCCLEEFSRDTGEYVFSGKLYSESKRGKKYLKKRSFIQCSFKSNQALWLINLQMGLLFFTAYTIRKRNVGVLYYLADRGKAF